MEQDFSAYLDQSGSGGGGFGSSIFSLALSVMSIVALWFIFVKAGEEGWCAIIPFYNVWVNFRIVYGAGWKCLLLLVPLLNIAVYISYAFRLPQSFGYDWKMGVLNLFFPHVVQLILAFGPSTYSGPATYSFL